MKFLLLLVVALVVVWVWRSNRPIPDKRSREPATPSQPQDMVRCALCGVHLPQGDAVAGRDGLYCSVEHQQRAES